MITMAYIDGYGMSPPFVALELPEISWFRLTMHDYWMQGERNFNRFGGWLGKNSTAGKNRRLMEDLHVHVLASRESSAGRLFPPVQLALWFTSFC